MGRIKDGVVSWSSHEICVRYYWEGKVRCGNVPISVDVVMGQCQSCLSPDKTTESRGLYLRQRTYRNGNNNVFLASFTALIYGLSLLDMVSRGRGKGGGSSSQCRFPRFQGTCIQVPTSDPTRKSQGLGAESPALTHRVFLFLSLP